MRVKDLGSRPAPTSIRDLLLRMVRGQVPAISVPRREIPYWEERGWTRRGNVYTGNYQTQVAAFQGQIEQEWSGRIRYYLFRPSEAIQRHSHWVCFQPRSGGWYLVHMAKPPRDVSSGILTIERLIEEAYEL
jgi:hypothetical protein